MKQLHVCLKCSKRYELYQLMCTMTDGQRSRSRSRPKTSYASELESGGGGGDFQFSSSEVSVRGSNTHPIPTSHSMSTSAPIPASDPPTATLPPVSLSVPVAASLADVPQTAVDADRMVQSDYLSPYCTEIAIRYYHPLTSRFISLHLASYAYIFY